MEFSTLAKKLGLRVEEDFASVSSDKPYSLEIFPNAEVPYFVFESKALSSKYFSNNYSEMLVAIRDTIKDAKHLDKLASESRTDMQETRWSAGPVSITATKMELGNYKVLRENKMVSTTTELTKIGSRYHVLRKVGMYPASDMRFNNVEEALYVFMANFDTARLSKEDVRESLIWSHQKVSAFENKKIPLHLRLDGKQSGMLARPVSFFYDGVKMKGVLLSLRKGITAEVATENYGVLEVDKKDIWIE